MLATVFAPVFLVGAAVFAILAATASPSSQQGRTLYIALAAVCAVFAVVALSDLYVIRRRTRTEHRGARRTGKW
ncbi:hypothetical protein [Streptomyces silvisoli]|uniref:Uncharacterized protein n=1 Tax=Streptomyces silvisoli TaxID=3034235 RepID=A0ABT5ZWV3_9ACTN|nr:hypothetical protein [Streptomyces silvisoli]MDF3294307.1 hypothetical protein [Streptomyces silvisoli]